MDAILPQGIGAVSPILEGKGPSPMGTSSGRLFIMNTISHGSGQFQLLDAPVLICDALPDVTFLPVCLA